MACQFTTESGAAPAGGCPADRSALLPKAVGQGFLVREDLREVSSLWGGVMSPAGSPPVRPITGRPWLAPSSFPRRLIGSPHGSLPLAGRRRAGWPTPTAFSTLATAPGGGSAIPGPQ